MRRCECRVRSPSKRRKRCLPWASTARTAWPSSARASGRARGGGAAWKLLRHAALEHAPDAIGGVVDRVALGHGSKRYAESVSLRGPARKPSSSSSSLQREPTIGSPSTRSTDRRVRRPRWTWSASAREGDGEALVLGRAQGEQAPPAALDVEDRLGAHQDDVALRGARGRPAVIVALGPGQHRAVGLGGVGGGEHQDAVLVVLAPGAQALDRPGERELGAAQALDEVAATGDPQRLEGAQRVIEGGEASRHALGQHLLAGEDPVALQQELGERAAPRAGLRRVPEQPLGERPAALHLALGPGTARGEAPRTSAVELGARARQRQARRRAAAPRRRWWPRRPTPGPTAPPGGPRRKLHVAQQVGEEAGAGGQAGADGVVLGRGRALAALGRRSDQVRVLPEVDRDPARAAASAPRRPTPARRPRTAGPSRWATRRPRGAAARRAPTPRRGARGPGGAPAPRGGGRARRLREDGDRRPATREGTARRPAGRRARSRGAGRPARRAAAAAGPRCRTTPARCRRAAARRAPSWPERSSSRSVASGFEP